MGLEKCFKTEKKIMNAEQMLCLINAGKKSLIIEGGKKTGKSTVLKEMYSRVLAEDSSEKIVILKDSVDYINFINDVYSTLADDGVVHHNKCLLLKKEREKIIDEALKRHKDKFGRHRFHNIDAELWMDEFDWIKGSNICKDEIDSFLNIDRSVRDKKLNMNVADRVIAFQIFSYYENTLEDKGYMDPLDQAVYLYRHKDIIKDSVKIDHIFVDDAHNLQMVQISILKQLYSKTGVITVNDALLENKNVLKCFGDGIDTVKLVTNMEPTPIDTVEEVQKDVSKNKATGITKRAEERRKYTIDTSKARSGSLFRQLQEKEGTRIRLRDGINVEDIETSKLDKEKFNELVETKTLESFIEACKMLRLCRISRSMDDQYKILITRMRVLQDSIDKYKDVYEADIYEFCEYYVPESLRLTEKYLEHVDAGLRWKILHDNEVEIVSALEGLVVAVNDKIEEIYRFASINLEAKARALESVMSQDGYVKPEYRM